MPQILQTLLTILVTILVFGFLILIHEFGHYIFARIFGVTVVKFSVGMGPELCHYTSKKTGIRYAVSVLPIGGYVAMAGEDDESDDPNAFHKKPAWQRLIITAAGATVNIVVGVLIMIIVCASVRLIPTTTIHSFVSKEESKNAISSEDSGLMVGDTILKIGRKRVVYADELGYEVMRQGTKPVDVTVLRNGEVIVISGVVFPGTEASGQSFGTTDFVIYGREKTFGGVLRYAFRRSVLIVRMCWESIFDLITGRYTLGAVSGPVGLSSAIGEAAQNGLISLLNITTLISINLGVMNLLPIPALDGGRLVTTLAEIVTRRRIPPKVEGIINTVGLFLLLGLTAVVMVKDVFTLIFG
mgnify:CR=1 FL=1